jgi:hypothetical protein
VLGVFILLTAATASNSSAPLLNATTGRSPEDFGSCFTQAEEQGGRAWAYMPTERGGTFTDSGAREAPASYWLQVRAVGPSTEVHLFGAQANGASSRLIQAVNQCR